MPKPPTTSDGLCGLRFSQYTIPEVERLNRWSYDMRELNRQKHRELVRQSKKRRLSFTERDDMDNAGECCDIWDCIHKNCMSVLCGVKSDSST